MPVDKFGRNGDRATTTEREMERSNRVTSVMRECYK